MEAPRYNNPYICTDCHLASKAYTNVSNAPTVSEHFLNGTNLKATSKNASIILSCKTCHNLVEMIVENGDIEEASFDADGDGINGTNLNFYHYGKNRSDLRVTRNSSSCGDGSNTNCSKLNTFPANTNYTYTNCSYCHQNTTTSFELAMNDTGHKSMLNHTDSSVGPYCTDCHIAYDGNTTVRIHDQQLVKPFRNYTVVSDRDGMLNSSLCTTCHLNKEVHAESELTGELDSDTLECAACHANVSNYTTGFGEKQIHGIRYLNDSGVYSSQWLRSSAANCTTCHQGSLLSEVWINSTYSVTIPKVPQPLNHSDNASAGSLWNNTDSGFFGPWKNPESNNLRGCLYCHGNVDKSQTTVDDINLTVHNATALGRVNLIYLNNSIINGSISSTSYVCSQCHYPGHPNRTAVIAQFTGAGFEAPQNNTYNESGDPSYFYNHSDYLASTGYGDSVCNTCHGSLLGDSANMTEFAHNVATGVFGNQSCISCHDVSKPHAVKKINFTAFKSSVHANLNSNATNTTYIEDPVVKACWARLRGLALTVTTQPTHLSKTSQTRQGFLSTSPTEQTSKLAIIRPRSF
jgi:hypothetical protein